MRLRPQELEGGLLFWSPTELKVSFDCEARLPNGRNLVTGTRLSKPNGSPLNLPYDAEFQLTITPRRWADRIESLRVVRLTEYRLVTYASAGSLDIYKMSQLQCIPNYGIYHRLVMHSPYLAWENDLVLLSGDLVIRLVTGTIAGEKISPMDEVESEGDGTSITGQPTGSAVAEGRFVEVVAPGSTPRAAKAAAYSLLGLVSLLMGKQVVGEIVFNEAYEAQPGKQQAGTLQIPIVGRAPRSVSHNEIDQIDRVMSSLFDADRLHRARQRALRWYFSGVTNSTPEDKLFAFFIGMECLINAFALEYGPIPAAIDRKKNYEPLISKFVTEADTQETAWLRGKIGEPSLRERAEFYAECRSLDGNWLEDFIKVNEQRNDAFHGRDVHIDETSSDACERLLMQLLKAEFGVVGKLPGETVPGLGPSLGISYSLPDPDHPEYPYIDQDEEPA